MNNNMAMISLHDRLPKLAEAETRSLILPKGNKDGLPEGAYIFIESYCNLKLQECDCRRVFLNVFNGKKFLATIGYGWESLLFYERWFNTGNIFNDKEIIKEIKGPTLELGGYSSEYAYKILDLFKNYILGDALYIERLKRHYNLFKKA
ncbi:MAG: hypothetical protein ACYDAO_08845 [Thermoplasmataceae archaeon]